MTQTPRLEEVQESAISERLRTFYTALPAEIVSFDANTDKATIRCRVTNSIEDSKGDKVWHTPTIQNVPVQFPGSGTDRITFPIKAGAQVIYLVSTLPLHEWLNKGSSNLDIDPVSFNNLVSGWIVPGIALTPPTDTPQDALVIHSVTKVKVGGSSGTEPTIMQETWEDEFGDVISAIATALSGIVAGAGTPVTSAWNTFKMSPYKTTKTEVK